MAYLGILDLLTSREKALIVWSVVLLAGLGWWAFHNPDLRRPLADLARAFFRFPQLWLLIAATAVYVAGVVFAAHELGLWHTDSAKETTYWFFGTGVILAATAVTATHRAALLAKITSRAVRLTILVEFLVTFLSAYEQRLVRRRLAFPT